jgi:hypothetical protein
MITLPIAEEGAAILVEVVEGLPGGESVVSAIWAAQPRAGMCHVSLTTPDAQWLHDQLVPIHRLLVESRKRSGKDRRLLRTLNRVIPMLAYYLER